ncbi:MAG: hypothetical protein Ct9H90mP1_0680 [Methanobacteriota archaeon]|nr:MAG: hypothetical protein Ct9H90mP1_0680 [Euryarchaeota archaeon]
MQTDLILQLALAGKALGLFEGVRPGPLLTMVIRETLTGGVVRRCEGRISSNIHGWSLNRDQRTAVRMGRRSTSLMFTISMLGAFFLLWFGIDCFRIEPPDSDIGQQEVTGSFSRGVITNLLNPNVYVFWFLIGGPLWHQQQTRSR